MRTFFGKLKDGREVFSYTISSSKLEVTVLDYGAILQRFLFDNTPIILGFDNLQKYEEDKTFQGAIIGRHAGRIEEGTLNIDGINYKLEQNNGNCHLHGGDQGFNQRLWNVIEHSNNHITFEYSSPHGECGYPANLNVSVSYRIDDNNFILEYHGESSRKTICNLTNHAYFNLSGKSQSIEDHILYIDSDYIVSLGDDFAPKSFMEISNTPFDFRNPKPIRQDINIPHPQLILAKGYDHPFALKSTKPQIQLYSPDSKISLSVSTDQPAAIIYTGNFLGDNLGFRKGICIETQNFPNAVNHSELMNSTTFTSPTQPYQQTTYWAFTKK
ncbi:MAG: aldose epimerase family protein [Brevinema sp.]